MRTAFPMLAFTGREADVAIKKLEVFLAGKHGMPGRDATGAIAQGAGGRARSLYRLL